MIEKQCRDIIKNYKTGERSLAIPQGNLIPVPFGFKSEMKNCAVLLSKWRIENPSLSPAEFNVSVERTEKWLQHSVIENDERLLFMIYNSLCGFVGHIGISGFDYNTQTIRMDSVLRGIKGVCPGIMQESIEAVKAMARKEFDASHLDLVVLSDNQQAIDLYTKCGFTIKGLIPLKKIEENGEINWIEDLSLIESDKYFLNMICDL